MAIVSMIMGESGSGKSTSLRNLNPSNSLLIQVIKKPLPFPSKEWKAWDNNTSSGSTLVLDDHQEIIRALSFFSSQAGKKVIIIDDFQYLMANEFMRRSGETGFAKFTELAKHAWEVIMFCQSLPDDVRVYFLSHTQTTEFGECKVKTIGKLLDEKITLEGLFTIVLKSLRKEGKYQLQTQTNGNDTVKSPMGLFDDEFIDNDLNEVDNKIFNYYIGE